MHGHGKYKVPHKYLLIYTPKNKRVEFQDQLFYTQWSNYPT